MIGIRPRPNIISRLKVFLVKESTRIKIILIASYFFSKIELATIDIHYSFLEMSIVGNASSSEKGNSTVLGMSRCPLVILNHLHQNVCSCRCVVGGQNWVL